MPVNRRSVTMMSASGTEMNKYSNPVKGDSYYGYTDGIHTMQVTYNQFVGRIRIQATLALEPTESDYFDLVVTSSMGTAFNEGGYLQFNANAPGNVSYYPKAITHIKIVHGPTTGDGATYDNSRAIIILSVKVINSCKYG